MKMPLLHFLIPILFFSCQSSMQKTEPQKLNLHIPADPVTLDPRRGGDFVSSMMHFLLFDGLTRMNPDGSTVLSLAESVEILNHHQKYIFHLKEAYWSDETPITAMDFEYSWKTILSPSFPAPNAHLLYPIRNAEEAKRGLLPISEVGVYSIDVKTLCVELQHPTPYFLELVAFCVFFPVKKGTPTERQNEERVPCNGPFFLEKWKHNNEIVLKKNLSYHKKEEVYLESIHYSIVDNESTALQMFEKREIDILGYIPTDSLPDLIKRGLVQIRPMAATTFCAFNTLEFPFNNQKIRKAFAYAINRQQIIEHITQLNEEIALGMIPPVLKNNETRAYFHDADIEKAKALFAEGLKEEGVLIEDFPELTYVYSVSQQHRKVAEAIQHQWWMHLGVKVKLENIDHKILLDKLAKRNYQIAQTYWIAQYHDPMSIFERFKFKENVKNYPHWENQDYIHLLNRSFYVQTTEERKALLEKAEEIFMDQMPLIPIFHWNSAFVAHPYIKSCDLGPIGNAFYDKIFIDQQLRETILSRK